MHRLKLAIINSKAMTTGKKFEKRTSDDSVKKVLDNRTKAILNAVISEPRGQALTAYLKAMAADEQKSMEAALPG